jgi:hypothetical protein
MNEDQDPLDDSIYALPWRQDRFGKSTANAVYRELCRRNPRTAGTIREFTQLTADEVEDARGIGLERIIEIRRVLAAWNLRLEGDDPGAAQPPDPLARAMSETQLEQNITSGTGRRPGLCKVLKLRYYFTKDSRKSPEGFPDLVITGPRGTVFRELKDQDGTLTPEQRAWLADLRESGEDAQVWRPSDWRSGRIERELRTIAAPARGGDRG